ncbi:MAG: cytochrome c class [Gemmatimonadetes bacterium]|nr:cytochrome c class [Gemmatimonadota bacterium]
MRRVVALVLAAGALLAPCTASAQRAKAFAVPDWAFPFFSTDYSSLKPPYDSVTPLRVPGSDRSFTSAQVHDQLNPPDWAPGAHPAAPAVVLHAPARVNFACGYCHLPSGLGRSENAMLAGLRVDYIKRQLADFKTNARHSPVDNSFTRRMHEMSLVVTDSEVDAAARYFAALKPMRRATVQERERIPAVWAVGGLYAVRPGADSEPLAGRLIEVTDDLERHELRDANDSFTTYVPVGSVKQGKRIATTDDLMSPTRCVTCHGLGVRGTSLAPGIAGRSPTYLLRQLLAFRAGTRATSTSGPMQKVASRLSLDEMVAVVAYVGTLVP